MRVRRVGGVACAALVLGAGGCKALPEADRSLSESIVATLVGYEDDEETIAATMRELEQRAYESIAVASADLAARSAKAVPLTADDIEHLQPNPGLNPSYATTVTLTRLSPFSIDDHARIPMVTDPAPAGLEPTAKNHYDRTYEEGLDCWQPRDCAWLRTSQELTKEVPLAPSVTYTMLKRWRWVDLSAGTGDAPRWAFLAVNWNPDSFVASNGQGMLHQSYGVEVWIPRDGRGFTWEGAPPEPDFADSAGDGGVLRLFTLWAESELGPALDPQTEQGTIRWGTDQNFLAHERWLEDNVGE